MIIVKNIRNRVSLSVSLSRLNTLFEQFDNNSIITDFNVMSDFGIILDTYNKLYLEKDKLKDIFLFIGEIDYYLSTIKILNSEDVCFPNYIINDKPYFSFGNIWHPSLIKERSVVKNSITIEKNICITGPNAGGKSVFIKS